MVNESGSLRNGGNLDPISGVMSAAKVVHIKYNSTWKIRPQDQIGRKARGFNQHRQCMGAPLERKLAADNAETAMTMGSPILASSPNDVPQLLRSTVPRDELQCAGLYRIIDGRLANGFPLW